MTNQAPALTRKELFLRAARCEPVPRLPVWMMRQAGRYLPEYREIRAKHSFLEVCKNPDLAVEVSLQPFRRLGVDAIIIFSDILIPAEAMGLPLELADAGPNLPQPVRSDSDVKKLQIFDPEMETGFLMEALRRTVKQAGPEVAVLGFAASPWTLACYMVEGRTKEGFATVKSFLYREPRVFRELLHKIGQATILYLRAQIAAGVCAVQLFDTWCGELDQRDYAEFVLPAVQQVIYGLGNSVPSSITRRPRTTCCPQSCKLAPTYSAWTGAFRSPRRASWRDLAWLCKATLTPPCSLLRTIRSATPHWISPRNSEAAVTF